MKSRFFLGGIMVVAIALILVNQSSAEEQTEGKVIILESQMSKLIESQDKLTGILQEALLPNDKFKNPDPEPQQAGGDGTKFPPAYICTEDYSEWPSSYIYEESEWAMESMYATPNGSSSYFSDVNGDGLMDYYFINNTTTQRRTCLQLNNGRGWEMAHQCYAERIQGVWKFYGDCAKTE